MNLAYVEDEKFAKHLIYIIIDIKQSSSMSKGNFRSSRSVCVERD